MDHKKPTAEEVIHRALALQLIVDRGWSDVQVQKGSSKERQKLKRIRTQILDWTKKEELTQYLSKIETKIWKQPFGKLSDEDRAYTTWQLESLIPLAWAIGLRKELPEYSAPGTDNHYPALEFCKPDPILSILSSQDLTGNSEQLARTPEEIELYTNAYLLLNWRAREIALGNKKRINIRESAPALFGKWVGDAVSILPLDKKGEIIINQLSLIITELNKRELFLVQRTFELRQKAFNWLSGDHYDWDFVSTDT